MVAINAGKMQNDTRLRESFKDIIARNADAGFQSNLLAYRLERDVEIERMLLVKKS